jgi:hypothetical protein
VGVQVTQDTAATILVVAVLGEEDAVVGLLQQALQMFLAATVSSGDGEEVTPDLLVCIVFGLVVQEDAQNGRHHSRDIGAGHWVVQHDQGHRDDHDSLGGIRDRVAQAADEVGDAESHDILEEVTEAADSQKQECPGPLGDIGQVTADLESREGHQNPRVDHEADSVAAGVDLRVSQQLFGENVLQ